MRIVLATIVGWAVSVVVNLGILEFFMPVKVEEGVDQYEVITEMMKSFTFGDFLVPLSAHILSILFGLIVARLICKTSNIPIYIVGGLHMLGTVINIIWLTPPLWFIIVDITLPILIILYFLRTKKKQ
jgi:hypothetical protein